MGKVFGSVLGQKKAKSILEAQLSSGKISHAYIFLGSEGTGKEYMAKEFAKYILCSSNKEDGCDSCRRFSKGAHPDFIYVDGREGIKIETVREANERINLSPNMSKYKVLLMSSAEKLGIEAANALLKTLEEPPSDSVLILTAISEKSLPGTIISRAQKIKLWPLKDKEMQKVLVADFSEDEIQEVLPMAGGSAGEARKLIEDKEYFNVKKALYEDLMNIFESESIIEKFILLDKYEKSKGLRGFFDTFSDLIFESLDAAISEEKNDYLERICNVTKFEDLRELSKKILKIYADLDYNINLRLAWEGLILEHLVHE